MEAGQCAVIVGAGQAGVTAAVSLRDGGWLGDIHLIGDEPGDPYQRPPLSKGLLAGTEEIADVGLRARYLLESDRIEYRDGVRALSIDRAAQSLKLDDGKKLRYDVLIMATGAAPRRTLLPGTDANGVHVLRTHSESLALRAELETASDVVIIGGGFIGLEVAALTIARSRVTVLEAGSQLLGRAVSAPTAEALGAYHASRGIDIRLSAAVEGIEVQSGRAVAVRLATGETLPADVVVLAVGAAPRTALAEQAGLQVDGGIVVDERLRTSDPAIRAIGDCARYPSVHADGLTRLESVQNAVDQARYVARDLIECDNAPYRAVPWFWSQQGEHNLQIVGVASPNDEAVIVSSNTEARKLVVHRFRGGRLAAVETISEPRVHIRARRTLVDGPAMPEPV